MAIYWRSLPAIVRRSSQTLSRRRLGRQQARDRRARRLTLWQSADQGTVAIELNRVRRTSCSGLMPISPHTTSKDQSDDSLRPSRHIETVPLASPKMPCPTAAVDGHPAQRSQTKRGLNAPEYICHTAE
jgi:hypothetical protein